MLVVIAMVLVGVGAYNLGVSHGVAVNPQIAAGTTPGGPPVVVYPYGYGWHRPFGVGFLFPLLFFGFWFLAARALFWRGGWRGYGPGCGGYGAPSGLEHWHRRVHDQMKTDGTTQTL
jgi:hypothetical protein